MSVVPSAVEAERAVIGAILLDNQVVNTALDLVSAAEFYRDSHRIIYQSIQELSADNRAIELVTLADHLKARGELDRIGGLSALGEMARETASAANIEAHCKLIREKAQLRRLLDAAERIKQNVASSSQPTEEILEEAEREIFQVATQKNFKEPVLVKDIITGVFDKIQELSELKGRLTGVGSGYPDLDDKTAGFQKSDLIILAGRPSMGKSALALNFIENVILNEKLPVVLFSLEMSAQSVVMRLLSSISKVSFERIRKGKVSLQEQADLAKAANRLSRVKFFIDDSSNLTPLEVRSRCRRLISQTGPLGLVSVDYLQMMTSNKRSDNRVQEVSEISRALKSVARELDVPMLVLSQLSRAPEHRKDFRPQLSDLRDSGAIEQDADIVAFIHREDYAGRGGSGAGGEAELLIRKHRNGETGMIPLVFIGELMRFESAARDEYAAEETKVYDAAEE